MIDKYVIYKRNNTEFSATDERFCNFLSVATMISVRHVLWNWVRESSTCGLNISKPLQKQRLRVLNPAKYV